MMKRENFSPQELKLFDYFGVTPIGGFYQLYCEMARMAIKDGKWHTKECLALQQAFIHFDNGGYRGLELDKIIDTCLS